MIKLSINQLSDENRITMSKLIGIDIGGTSITAGIVVNGIVESKVTLATESNKSKEEICENLFRAIDNVLQPGVVGIGIGVPGLVDSVNGTILQITNIPSWNGIQLKSLVEKKLGIKTYIENDANCFVLGIKHFGPGRDYNDIVAISLGTGLGAGILIDNKLYKGLNSAAGELCFIPYLDSNLEAYCSGSFFSKYYQTKGEDLFIKAYEGDKQALKIWDEFGLHISQLIRIVLLCYAPQIIVFGGSAAKGFRFFKSSMESNLESFELKMLLKNVLIHHYEATESAVLGAAALCV